MEFTLWRSMFWIPPIASTVLLALAWRSGILYKPTIPALAWAVALLLQGAAGLFSPAWVIGLLIQVVVAGYLAFKLLL